MTRAEARGRAHRVWRPRRRSRHAARAPATQRAEAGFSLLEVLGAIAILGIWFAIIAEIAMVGLRNEGRSQRALRASLVADEVLSEIEIEMQRGTLPEIDSTEEENEDGYLIRIDVEPYELVLPEPTSAQRSAVRGERPARTFQLLAGPDPDARSPLLSIRIEVAWQEGNSEASVTRYTFAVDSSQAEAALGALGQQPQDLDPDDSDDDDRPVL